jgi:hypothetical protein
MFLTLICRAIEELYTALPLMLDRISRATGWNGMIIFGGPNPSNNGEIDTIRYVLISQSISNCSLS